MTIARNLAADFGAEALMTSRFLRGVRDDRADWKPHDKSMTLAQLATHVVEMPAWAGTILDADHFDFAASDYRRPFWNTTAALTENHHRLVNKFLGDVEDLPDDFMEREWELRSAGKSIRVYRRDRALRDLILRHVVHHRGQLSVYFRLLGIPVPGAYGPSADERGL